MDSTFLFFTTSSLSTNLTSLILIENVESLFFLYLSYFRTYFFVSRVRIPVFYHCVWMCCHGACVVTSSLSALVCVLVKVDMCGRGAVTTAHALSDGLSTHYPRTRVLPNPLSALFPTRSLSVLPSSPTSTYWSPTQSPLPRKQAPFHFHLTQPDLVLFFPHLNHSMTNDLRQNPELCGTAVFLVSVTCRRPGL